MDLLVPRALASGCPFGCQTCLVIVCSAGFCELIHDFSCWGTLGESAHQKGTVPHFSGIRSLWEPQRYSPLPKVTIPIYKTKSLVGGWSSVSWLFESSLSLLPAREGNHDSKSAAIFPLFNMSLAKTYSNHQPNDSYERDCNDNSKSQLHVEFQAMMECCFVYVLENGRTLWLLYNMLSDLSPLDKLLVNTVLKPAMDPITSHFIKR